MSGNENKEKRLRAEGLMSNIHLQRDSLKVHPNTIRRIGLEGAATVAALLAYGDKGIGLITDYEENGSGFSPSSELDLGKLASLSGMTTETLLDGMHSIRDAGGVLIETVQIDQHENSIRVVVKLHDSKFADLIYGNL